MRFPRIFGGPREIAIPEVEIEDVQGLERLAEQREDVSGVLKEFRESYQLHQEMVVAYNDRVAADEDPVTLLVASTIKKLSAINVNVDETIVRSLIN